MGESEQPATRWRIGHTARVLALSVQGTRKLDATLHPERCATTGERTYDPAIVERVRQERDLRLAERDARRAQHTRKAAR